jgi:AraC-like DNA-binding protein
MINPNEYLSHIIILVPATTALLSSVVMAISMHDSQTHVEVRQKRTAIYFFLLTFLYSGCIYFYEFVPEIYSSVFFVNFLIFSLCQVSFHRIVFLFTSADENEHFSRYHYLAAVLATLLCLSLYESRALRVLLAVIFMSTYMMMSFYRLYHYHKQVTELKTLIYNPNRWLLSIIFFCFISVFASLVVLYVPREVFGQSPWSIFASISMTYLCIELCYHMVVRKYQFYLLTNTEKQLSRKLYHGEINQFIFERYIQKEKPYLNSDFRITDVVKALDVNRSLVSRFVNQTYGVNFSRYVNRCRLQELHTLLHLPSNTGKKPEQLAADAGFSDVKHYHRVRAQEKDIRL